MPLGKKPTTPATAAPREVLRGITQPVPTPSAKPVEGEQPLVKVVTELSKRRTRIDTLDTGISGLIKKIEETLRAHVSTRVFTIIGGGPSTDHPMDPDELYQEQLVFGKHDGRWQLLIESGRADEDHDWKTVPLLSAPRELRASVFSQGHVEKLVRGALTQLDEQITERELAHTAATNLAMALGRPDDDIDDIAPWDRKEAP